jgi:hypothetical protein
MPMKTDARKLNPAFTTSDPKHDDGAALAALDDAALIALLVQRDEGAWCEFVRRNDDELRGIAGKRLWKAMRAVLDSDAVDDVIGDLYLHLLKRDMRCLQLWVARAAPVPQEKRHESLMSWMVVLINGIAVDHIRAALLRVVASFDGDDDGDDDDDDDDDEPRDRRRERNERDANPGRGAYWVAVERGLFAEEPFAEEPMRKRYRNRKSSDDK